MITLNNIMRANAASCIGFGFLFLLKPAEVIQFLASDFPAPKTVLLIIGAGLVLNGIHLIWASFKPMPSKFLVLYFSFGDYLWVIGSISLLLLGVWITSTAGAIVTLVVSAMVGSFGILQMQKRKEIGNY